MGQRHQIFIVARVTAHNAKTPRYRCVGAYHHQWCYGRLPLMATRRFISLIKQKDNAEIIEEEIRALQGKYALEEDKPRLPQAPCPYALFLLASAWCVDLEAHYTSGVSFENSVLDAKMGSTEGDNNEGITVIDISEPTNPSYCFVSIWGLEASSDNVPLSAEEYVRAYYPVPNDQEVNSPKLFPLIDLKFSAKETEEDVQKKIDSLRDERIMTLDVLAEAWPTEYKPSAPTSTSAAEDHTPASNPLPSLVDLSLKPAIEHGIQIGDTEELEGLVWLPGKVNLIKSILRGQDPFPDSGLSLLAKVVQHEAGPDKTALDLSGLRLSDGQIVSLLTMSEMKDIELLKLSHNPNITVDGLRQVLSITPNLRRLVLLETSISDEHIYELLIKDSKLFHTLEELIHPALFSWQNPARYPNGFGYVGVHNGHNVASASLAIFTPATLVQCLTAHLSPVLDIDGYEMYSHFGSSLVPQVAFASAVRNEGEPWGERHVHCFPSHLDTPFDGKGWLFADTWDMRGNNRYGFMTKGAGDSGGTWKICDFKTFLNEMALEGRPAPSENAVKKLETIFAQLDSKKNAKLWTHEEFSAFMQNFIVFNRRRY
ncbi:hypothetical protein FB451DRAFT_1016034 [Mycena latifolia]|nr:hypothetical protein FB451DRAFT_1016034 [Mycena latifolia]